MPLLNSKALTKIQSLALIAIIVVAAVSGGAAFVLWKANPPLDKEIRIGICANLDASDGKAVWQAAVLAVEQVNAEGGVLGRNLTIVAEDNDAGPDADISVGANALTKLITIDKADFVVASLSSYGFTYQDICAEQKTILISPGISPEELEQRVLDNYDKYKYFFGLGGNITESLRGIVNNIMTLRTYTGFNKVAWLDQDVSVFAQMRPGVIASLVKNGFEVVYQNSATMQTKDFTSYLAAIEASGAEILFPIVLGSGAIPLVKEWHDRESPFIVWGSIQLAAQGNFWEMTEGKCEYVSFVGLPTVAGYPLTNRTIAARESYIERWHENPIDPGVYTYDFVRFILPDALGRAGTTETEAVINALEKTDVETSTARHFMFTPSHNVVSALVGQHERNMDYRLLCLFQWQNGTQVPVFPDALMNEAGVTYKYPPWKGPWN